VHPRPVMAASCLRPVAVLETPQAPGKPIGQHIETMLKGFSIRQREPQKITDALPRDLHPVIRRILLARGIGTTEELQLELSQLLPPDQLGGVHEAAKMLAAAIMSDQRILVVGDFDADGATGTAVAVLGMQAMGGRSITFRVPNRFEFGYGLTVPLVQTLADDPPDVLVTVDSGIACNAGVEKARELGCKVIITDHHLPGKTLPRAHAIVNPNIPGDAFPSKAMAGVGVMFYLLSRVRKELQEQKWFTGRRKPPKLASLLDLVALGTVADLVPLDQNNRVLVNNGLKRIRNGLARPGLLALLRAGNRDYRFTAASDLGFAVAPRLNAAGRLEDMSVGIRCLLADQQDTADGLARQLDELNQQRKDMQDEMQASAMLQIQELVKELEQAGTLEAEPNAVCLFDPDWHQGIVGLVASRVKDFVHKPVFAFAPESSGSSLLKGSARSVPGLHIRDVLALVDSRVPGMMTAFGGHAMAAGLSLPLSALDDFRQQLAAAVDTILNGETLSAEVFTDGMLAPGDISLDFARQLEELGPWGQRFAEPLFEGRFEIVDQRVVGVGHMKLRLRAHESTNVVDAIAFNCSAEDLGGGSSIRALYRLDINRWRGQESAQLRVERILDK